MPDTVPDSSPAAAPPEPVQHAVPREPASALVPPDRSPGATHGLVIGKFYPPHAGHHHVIRTALRECSRVTVEVLAASVESIPLSSRVDWLREEHPTARVVGTIDDAEVDYQSEAAWQAHLGPIGSLLDAPVDVVFGSEDYGRELARRLGARWRPVDTARITHPVSGTAVRADLGRHWHELASAVRAGLAARIVVVGAESTGTTTLSSALAERVGAAWVPEYGREYSLIRRGGPFASWLAEEFEFIAGRQQQLQRQAARTTPVPMVVSDTDVLTTALFRERYLGSTGTLLDRALADPPDLYLLTGDEIPWEADDTRDGRDIRQHMQQRFREVLAGQHTPWVELRGTAAERLARAIPLVESAVAVRGRFAAPLG